MPCWDSYLQYVERKKNFSAQQHPKDAVTEHLESMIHSLTRMLCSLCKKVESSFPSYFLENAELSAWWEEHKKNDKENEIRDLKSQINDMERRIISLMQGN
jgi:hypothetical protein